MSLKSLPLSVLAMVFALCLPTAAASLQVQPAMVEVPAPGAASTISLRNEGDGPITVQIRMFSWTQSRGVESLAPTEAVVASPPAVRLAPGIEQVVRIVRVGAGPVAGEEAYRLIVDQLPDGSVPKSGSVNLLMRYSIPVFFTQTRRSEAQVDWAVTKRDGRIVVSARNRGDRHLRISQLSLRDAKGREISFGKGLVGYALGRSTMSWIAPAANQRFAGSGQVSFTGQGNDGPFRATAPITSKE